MPPNLGHIVFNLLDHMGSRSAYYNNILAMGVTGVDNGKGGKWEKIHGDHAVKLNGRTYHYLNKGGGMCGLQYFTFDARASLDAHADVVNLNENRTGGRVKKDYLMRIFNELKECNHVVKECEQIGLLASSRRLENANPRNLIAHMNTQTSVFNIAAITGLSVSGDRNITFQLKEHLTTTTIPTYHRMLEPLCYPILFPYGSGGWGKECPIDFGKYLCCRMLMPDFVEPVHQLSNAIPIYLWNNSHTRQIPVNRFQCMSRLSQYYLTDMVSRNIDSRLRWQATHQHVILGPQGSLRNSAIQQGESVQNQTPTFLSQSLHGSRRHLKSLASNALNIVSEYGKPSLFITLTCNPYWPEIQEMLLPNQSAFDRPDIVCQVFKERLAALIRNIRSGKYFDDTDNLGHRTRRRKIIYELRVIEYQHRGLPHAHIVIKLDNTPSDNPEECGAWIDRFISCQMPVINDHSSPNDIEYHSYVSGHMVHRCVHAVNGCLDQTNHCTKGFTDTVIAQNTTFDDRGCYAVYKRLSDSDLRVCPHNKGILMDWQGHAYVDWCGSTYTVLYLYKVFSLYSFIKTHVMFYIVFV